MFNKKYTEEDMIEAVAKATGMGFNLGYLKAVNELNSIIDSHGQALGLKPNYCNVVKQATVILQKDESERGEL